ncbi:hypothetical protein [Natrinema soli]|uniref:Twin-arginine translocation signal domain-containing protein n=1 Tax=Natrinema soli TaxID=1930624 RepID=A0ABD5SLP0_9EURY|nr:hypothetical protein [Natrinema soli]
MTKDSPPHEWLATAKRRRFLQTLGVGTAVSLAGCGQLSGSDEPEAGTETPESQPDEVGELTYMAPREAEDYHTIVEERKMAALEQVLAADKVGPLVTEAVSSSAYHRIFQDYDYIEILAPHDMTVSGTYQDATQEIEFSDIKQITALVDRENDQLVKLNTQTRESHILERSNEGLNMNTVNAALDNSRVANALEGKDWYIVAADYSIITAYSEEYPIGEVTPVIFNWNDQNTERVAIAPAVTTETTGSEADGNEVLDIYEPTQESPDPLRDIVDEVSENDPGDYRESAIDAPGKMDDTDWEIRRPDQTIEQNNWEVTWENTLHDACGMTASYKGKPVLGGESKVPYMLSDYEPFGMGSPGVPSGRRNFHFWDTLGLTGPGIIEKHELSDGFRLRGTYHTGSLNHWEWRFGQNFAPYRYIIDWNFHEDGTIDITSRHPTTGFRTTNGYPKYTFHLAVEPAFDSATVSVNDGSEWNQASTETRVDNSDMESLRVENADGPEQLVVTRPGDNNYALQYDPELIEYDQSMEGIADEMINDKQYLDPDNYLRDRSIDNERVYLRMYKHRDTGEGTHATTDPFAFRYTIQTKNY